MVTSLVLPAAAARETLNDDYQFRSLAAFWDARLVLRVGTDRYLLEVSNGFISRFELGADRYQTCTAELSADEEVWSKLLEEEPPPFYQDFFGAAGRHGFEMVGDLDSLFAHYGALLRVLHVLRVKRNEGGRV